MSDNEIKMRLSFLSYARPTLRMADKATTTEDWETAIRMWFDERDRGLWAAYEAGWKNATKLLLEKNNLVMFDTYED